MFLLPRSIAKKTKNAKFSQFLNQKRKSVFSSVRFYMMVIYIARV